MGPVQPCGRASYQAPGVRGRGGARSGASLGAEARSCAVADPGDARPRPERLAAHGATRTATATA